MKIAVYTCITGNYDELTVPQRLDNRLEYYCITDNPSVIIKPWKYIPIKSTHLSKKDQNRYAKMHCYELFPTHDVTIYVDGSIQIVGDVPELVTQILLRPEELFVYDHPFRSCIFSEAAACIHYSHDWIWTIVTQMRKYRKEGYPLDNGLFEAGVIIRKKSDKVQQFMNLWWNEYMHGTKRDQLSFPVAAWRLNFMIGSLGKSDPRFTHKYFKFINHARRRILKVILRKYINRTTTFLIPCHKLFGTPFTLKWK